MEYKFMETRLTLIKKNSFLLLFILFKGLIYAEDLNKIAINPSLTPSEYSKTDQINIKNPLKEISITYDQIYQLKRPLDQESLTISSRASNLPSKNILTLKENEFLEIKTSDKRLKLFNGSIIIKFDQIPDLNVFALNNDVELVSDLSDLKRGIFKIKNLLELERKINIFNENENIIGIELDTLDPLLKAR
jgi:hypothetical protein